MKKGGQYFIPGIPFLVPG